MSWAPSRVALRLHQWFEVMRKCGDEVRELLHDGCPVACLGDAPFGYVNVFTSHADVGFFHGGLAHPFLPHPKPRLPHPLRFSKGGLLRNLSCRRLAEELALHTVGMPTLSQRTRKNGAPSVWVIQRMGQPQAGLCL